MVEHHGIHHQEFFSDSQYSGLCGLLFWKCSLFWVTVTTMELVSTFASWWSSGSIIKGSSSAGVTPLSWSWWWFLRCCRWLVAFSYDWHQILHGLEEKENPSRTWKLGIDWFWFFYHTQLMILQGDIILLWVWSIELICLLLLQLWFVQLWYQQATEDTFVYIFFFSNLRFAGLGNKLHLDCCIRGGFWFFKLWIWALYLLL